MHPRAGATCSELLISHGNFYERFGSARTGSEVAMDLS